MIIVSQDKKRIVNFDNLTQVYITHCEEDNTGYFIRFETVDSLYEDLGEYATEERAKEVFNGIIRAYEKAGNLAFEINEDETEVRLIHNSNVFEMPEEWFYVKKTA